MQTNWHISKDIFLENDSVLIYEYGKFKEILKLRGSNPICLHSDIFESEILTKLTFLYILTKTKACITYSSAILI